MMRPNELVNMFMKRFADDPSREEIFLDLIIKDNFKKYVKAAVEEE